MTLSSSSCVNTVSDSHPHDSQHSVNRPAVKSTETPSGITGPPTPAIVRRERDELIAGALPAAEVCVNRFLHKLPPNKGIDHDALRSAALEALARCANRYDRTRGTTLASFAWPRMVGAMNDELRHLDVLSRTTRQRLRDISQACDALEKRHGRPPTGEEICAELNITLDELDDTLMQHHRSRAVSLDAPIDHDGDDADSLAYYVAATEDSTAEMAERASDNEMVARLVGRLPARERFVITMYYLEELTLKEIGEVLGVTESRVSQLHHKALSRMRLDGRLAA